MKLTTLAIAAVLVGGCASGAHTAPASSAQAASPGPIGEPSTGVGGAIVFARSDKNGAPAALFTIAADGSGRRQLAATYDCCARWSIDGKRILMSATAADGRVTTEILNADGTAPTVRALPAGTLNLGPGAWFADGRIAFEGWDDKDPSRNGIYLGDATGANSAVRVTTSPDRMHDVPLSASPDGARLLFVRVGLDSAANTLDDGALFEVDVAGGAPRQLNAAGTTVSTQTFWGDPASWFADGGRVAFVAYKIGARGDAGLDVVNVDGTGLRQIAPSADPYSGAHWSPDGQWILTDREATGGGAELILVHPDGTGLKSVSAGYACCGTWSPDGTEILYLVEHTADAGDLYTANADGSNATRVTNQPGHYEWYSWAPAP